MCCVLPGFIGSFREIMPNQLEKTVTAEHAAPERRRRSGSSERIDDGQAGNAPTGLEILRQQGVAPGIERGGDDQ